MVRAKKKKREVLSQTEIGNLQEEKKSLEQDLKEAEGYGTGGPGSQFDKSRIKSQIDRLDYAIHEASPGRLTGAQRDAFAKRIEKLKEIFQINMPTRYEMDHPAKCPGAVRKHMKWLNVNNEFIEEWRNLQRLLNPGEEESIEMLRKDR